MRKHAVALAVVVALAAFGCEAQTSAPQPGATPAAPPASGRKLVALLTEGSITDGGWNTAAYEGLKAIEKELGCEGKHLQTKTPQEFEDGFRDFAKQGAVLVIGHGHEFQDAAEKVGPEFPKATFLVMSGERPFANGAPVIFKIEEPMYLAGVAAGFATKTKKVACVGGMSIPPVVKGFKAFGLGAKRANKDVEVVEPAYLGGWGDAARGREQALALIANGVDAIMQNADKGGLGVFEAAGEKGALAFGSNKDQNAVKPGVILASATIDVGGAMVDAAKEVLAGTFKPSKRLIGIKDGRADLVLNEALAKDRLPAAAREAIAAARKDLVEGKIVLE